MRDGAPVTSIGAHTAVITALTVYICPAFVLNYCAGRAFVKTAPAAVAFIRSEFDFRINLLALGVAAPDTPERAAFEEYRRPDPIPIDK